MNLDWIVLLKKSAIFDGSFMFLVYNEFQKQLDSSQKAPQVSKFKVRQEASGGFLAHVC